MLSTEIKLKEPGYGSLCMIIMSVKLLYFNKRPLNTQCLLIFYEIEVAQIL